MAEQKPTEFAMKAMGLADLFQVTFGGEQLVVGARSRVGGGSQDKQDTYRLEISAPEGPSTGGGKQAVQHIKLVPVEGPTIVIGAVNQVETTAELRTFEYLAYVHAQRFKGVPLALQEGPYNELLKRMQSFCANYGLRLLMTDVPRLADGRPAPEAGAPGQRAPWMALAVFAAICVLGGIVYFLLHKPH
jgi:hypothetical protein